MFLPRLENQGWAKTWLGPSLGFRRHYFSHFQEMQEIMSAQTQTWHKKLCRAKNIKNDPKWVQNRPFGLKIGPRESYGHFGPVRTGPGPKKSKSMAKNRQDFHKQGPRVHKINCDFGVNMHRRA